MRKRSGRYTSRPPTLSVGPPGGHSSSNGTRSVSTTTNLDPSRSPPPRLSLVLRTRGIEVRVSVTRSFREGQRYLIPHPPLLTDDPPLHRNTNLLFLVSNPGRRGPPPPSGSPTTVLVSDLESRSGPSSSDVGVPRSSPIHGYVSLGSREVPTWDTDDPNPVPRGPSSCLLIALRVGTSDPRSDHLL